MLHCYFNNGRYIVIKNYLTLFHFCFEINEFSYSVLYCISLHELIGLQELKCYIEHEYVVLMRVCIEYLRRSLFSRGGIRLEQTVIFLRNIMIFLKVSVGVRKIATLTMEKTVRGGTTYIISITSKIVINHYLYKYFQNNILTDNKISKVDTTMLKDHHEG